MGANLFRSAARREPRPRILNPKLEDGDLKENKYFQILAGSTTFSGEPIIVVDEVGMKLDFLVELYMFLRFDSTFDRCLWKLEFEHSDLLVVQLDHNEQRAKMSEKKINR